MTPEQIAETQRLLERSQKSQDELRELIKEARQMSAHWNELDWSKIYERP